MYLSSLPLSRPMLASKCHIFLATVDHSMYSSAVLSSYTSCRARVSLIQYCFFPWRLSYHILGHADSNDQARGLVFFVIFFSCSPLLAPVYLSCFVPEPNGGVPSILDPRSETALFSPACPIMTSPVSRPPPVPGCGNSKYV